MPYRFKRQIRMGPVGCMDRADFGAQFREWTYWLVRLCAETYRVYVLAHPRPK
jgi:hypothetical protein